MVERALKESKTEKHEGVKGKEVWELYLSVDARIVQINRHGVE